MKTMNRMMFATAAVAVLAAGCSKDATKDIVEPAAATRTIEVTAGYDVGDDSRANYTDGKGLTWANNDALWAGYTDGSDKINGFVKSTAINIDGEGAATFTFTIPEGATMLRTYYPDPAGHTVTNVFIQPNFRIEKAQTQPAAGAMTNMQGAAGFVGTEAQDVSDATSYTTKLKAISSIVRFIIYSSDAKYNDYSVKSVSLQANNIAGICGLWTNWDVTDNRPIVAEQSNTVTVTLDTPYSLAGKTSQANAAGIYMGVMPTTSNGSTITVYTDKGRIAFESAKSKEYKANTIHNVYLDLAKGTPIAAENKLVFVTGNPNDVIFESAEGNHNTGLTRELTLDGVSILEEAKNHSDKWAHKVEWVTGGEGWLTLSFTPGDYAWIVKADKNKTAVERKAKVYLVYDGIQSVNYITFTQKAGSGVEIVPTLTKEHNATVSKDGATIEKAATLALTVNSATSSDVAADMAKYGVTLTCGVATTEVNAAGEVKIVFPKNDYASEKTYTLEAKFEDVSSKVTFTQEANEGGETAFPYTYTLNPARPWYPTVGSYWGDAANIVHTGIWAHIENIRTRDGKTITMTDEIANEITAYAFRNTAPTDEEKSNIGGGNYSGKTSSTTAAVMTVSSYGNDIIHLTITFGKSGEISKVHGYDSDGVELGYWYIWAN